VPVKKKTTSAALVSMTPWLLTVPLVSSYHSCLVLMLKRADLSAGRNGIPAVTAISERPDVSRALLLAREF